MALSRETHTIKVSLTRGKKLKVPVWTLDSKRPGPCFLLIAAQHGNEVQGIEAIGQFMDLAEKRLKAGKVIAVPFGNLPAIRDRRPHIHMGPEQPYADHRGHNINRTWPGKRNGNDSERLAWALYQDFGQEVTHCLDIHCWAKFKEGGLIIYDLPELRSLARKIGHRYVELMKFADHGFIDTEFCRTGRVGICYECCGQYLIDVVQVRKCLRVILNMAHAIGILNGQPEPKDRPIIFSDEMEKAMVTAPCSGLFGRLDLELGQKVRKGQLLGTLLSDEDLKRHKITAPASGFLRCYDASRGNCDVALPAQHPYASEGDRLAEIVWRKKVAR